VQWQGCGYQQQQQWQWQQVGQWVAGLWEAANWGQVTTADAQQERWK